MNTRGFAMLTPLGTTVQGGLPYHVSATLHAEFDEVSGRLHIQCTAFGSTTGSGTSHRLRLEKLPPDVEQWLYASNTGVADVVRCAFRNWCVLVKARLTADGAEALLAA